MACAFQIPNVEVASPFDRIDEVHAVPRPSIGTLVAFFFDQPFRVAGPIRRSTEDVEVSFPDRLKRDLPPGRRPLRPTLHRRIKCQPLLRGSLDIVHPDVIVVALQRAHSHPAAVRRNHRVSKAGLWLPDGTEFPSMAVAPNQLWQGFSRRIEVDQRPIFGNAGQPAPLSDPKRFARRLQNIQRKRQSPQTVLSVGWPIKYDVPARRIGAAPTSFD